MKVAVIGIGNTAIADDGVGVFAVRTLRTLIDDVRVSFHESERGGLDLLDLLSGCDKAILVDAACTGIHLPGSVLAFTVASHSDVGSASSLHTIGLNDLLGLGSVLGVAVPPDVTVVCVEARDIETFGAPCTPEVTAALPGLVRRLRQMLLDALESVQVASYSRETAPS